MSDAVITVILTLAATILEQKIRREYTLLTGVEKEVKKLTTTFKSIKAVLIDAENRQVKEETIKLWLEKLVHVSYDAEDVLSEWVTALHTSKAETHEGYTIKVRSLLFLPCFGWSKVTLRRDIALKIKGINERLDLIACEKDRYKLNEVVGNEEGFKRVKTTSFVDVSEVRGREVDMGSLVSKLLSGGNLDRGLNVVSVLGMGGIGKTTLAQLVYNSGDVVREFEVRIWVCVSEPFDEVRIAKAIVEDVEGSAPYLFELETLLRRIRGYVAGKKYLLVLDDVWTEDHRKWEQLLNSLGTGGAGSTILVTSRNERVAKMMGSRYVLRLGQLSEQDSWSLFSKIAFFERSGGECEGLEDVGRKIVNRCKGLPLTLKTIGSLMRFKSSLKDWEGVLNSELWELEGVQGIFPPLMLSYYHLPSKMKQCLSYCAMFPKDHVIEADNLIKLWMAQGYLSSTENVEMELIGQEYLQNLAMRSFFQDMKKDEDGKRILSLKIHDMIHDFVQYLTKNECSVMEIDNNLERKMGASQQSVRHLTLIRAEDILFPSSVPNVEKLRTFWVQSFYDSPPIVSQLDNVEPDFFRRLPCIRAIDLSRNRIGELPKDIGKLINLKYLNLSHNPFWELPANLCDLYNLQTLKLSACHHLRILPREIGKLTNLRHLELDRTDSLKTLPKGIGKLDSLHTLSKFIIIVGKENDDETCGVEDLRILNNLHGFLKIEGLGSIEKADEAKQAELQNKKQLSDLEMDFTSSVQTGREDEVIDAFEPHENLQSLQISSYGGTKFPSWIMKLANVQNVFLKDSRNCTNLPALGKLPFLTTLLMEGMKNVKYIGLEFLGVDTYDKTSNQSGRRLEESVVFPKLKKLKISNMESLEEWDMTREHEEFPDEDFTVMPRLRCLKISGCSKLKALPRLLLQVAPISKLRIHSCPLLQQQYQKKTGENWSKISHISKVRIS